MEINYHMERRSAHVMAHEVIQMFQEVFLTKFTVKLITFPNLDDVATNENIFSYY